MEKIYTGKTKDVYQLDGGNIRLKFKDEMTGHDGVFDPGSNEVGLSVPGSGRAGLGLSKYYFEKLNAAGVPTHYLSADLDDLSMDVKPVDMFGQGVEVICRYRAEGSFIRRYGAYAKVGEELPGLIELTLKDDERQDPLIAKNTLQALGIMNADDYERVVKLTAEICDFIRDDLAAHDLTLADIKLEFGLDRETGEVLLIDELSGGNMRVFYDDGEPVDPLKIGGYLLND